MKKRILSLFLCFVLYFGIAYTIEVDAFATHYVTIKEGEEVWLDAGPYLSGQDVASWSFEWEDMQLTRYVEIVQKSSDWRRCKVRGIRVSGDYVGRIYFNYKKWLSGLGMYHEDTISFQITVLCNHSYGNEEIIKQASVGVAGQKRSYCSRCGNVLNTTIPALTFAEAFKPEIKSTKAYGKSSTNFVRVSPPAVDIDPTKQSIKIGNNKLYYMKPTGVYVGLIGNMTAAEAQKNLQIVSGASEVIKCGIISNASGNTPTASDYGIVKRVVLKKTKTLTDKQFMAADVNSDGVINAADYGAIKRVVLKKDSTFKKP